MYKELVRLVGRALFLLLLAVMPAEAGAFRLIWTQEATIADILAAFKAKELTCRQLVQMYLDRIEAYDRKGPALNAIVMVNPNALATADALDAKFAQSGLAGPLHCVPVIVKDNYDTVDMPTSAGSLSLKGSTALHDAFQVRKLREAGALVGGRADWNKCSARCPTSMPSACCRDSRHATKQTHLRRCFTASSPRHSSRSCWAYWQSGLRRPEGMTAPATIATAVVEPENLPRGPHLCALA